MGGTITKKIFRRGALLLGLCLGIAGFAGEAQAQPAGCVADPTICQTQFNLPDCYTCDTATDQCVPDDSFCNGISGGNEDNQCRAGECLVVTFQDPNNPSGCDYSLDTGASVDCRNCLPDGLATLENCGNGICEPDEGEACNTCAVDCLLPGFPADTCPLTSGTVIQDACAAPPPSIVFTGRPPYNSLRKTARMETCFARTRLRACRQHAPAVPKACSMPSDFCCPGLQPAAGEANCGPNGNACDVDCTGWHSDT